MRMVRVCDRPAELPGVCRYQSLRGVCSFKHECKWMHVKHMVQGRRSGTSIIRQIEEAVENEIKPCPFCGCGASVMVTYAINGKLFYYVECDVCGAKTRYFHESKEAIEEWKRRFDNER